jgi:cytochrome d ubiquinol oxidase subunit I
VLLTFLSFRVMVGLGTLFILVAFWAWLKRKRPEENPLLLKALLWVIPLPYLAIEAGWTVTEVGRQPWIVWGVMRTSEAASPIASSQVAVSLVAFILVYGLLCLTAAYLMFKYARQGADPAPGEEAGPGNEPMAVQAAVAGGGR